MTLKEVIEQSNGRNFRRDAWTHADSIVIKEWPKGRSYGGGELHWSCNISDRVSLFYVDDLTATDWIFT